MPIRRFDKFRDVIENFLANVTQEAANNLAMRGKGGGNLEEAVLNSGRYKISPNSIQIAFDFAGADYAMFVDQGVAAAGEDGSFMVDPDEGINPLDSGTKFGFADYINPGPRMRTNLRNWLSVKGMYGFDDVKTNTAVFLIGRAVRREGIERTLFFTKPYRKYFKQLPDEFIEAFGFEIEDLYNFILK